MTLFPSLSHRADETPTSLVSRLALLHRAQTARTFCLDMDIGFQALVDGEAEALDRLASLANLSLGPISDAAIVRKDSEFSLRGQGLVKPTLRRARVVVCPRCLANDLSEDRKPWMVSGRVSWSLDPIRTCRHHRVALSEVANANAPGLLHDFARLVTPAIERIGRLADQVVELTPSPLEEYLLDRLDGHRGPAWLDNLPWHAAAKTCEMIGAVVVFGRKAAIKRMTDEQWREAGEAGFEIAANGVVGIRACLDKLRSTYPESRTDPSGPQAWFGRLHTWLAGTNAPGLDPLREIVVDMVRDIAPVSPEDRLFGRQIIERRRLHSIRTAALETGLHPKRLRRILAACEKIRPDHGGLSDDRVLFSAPDAEEILLKAKHAISGREAETYLNAGRVHTKLLASEGLIRPFANPGSEGLRDAAYDTRELDAFLILLTARAEIVTGHAKPICRIPEAAKGSNCSAAEIVRAILGGDLKWVGRISGEAGYLSVLVDVSEVRKLVRGEHGNSLPLYVVQSSLKTTFAVVDSLIRSGILPSQRAISPMNRCPYTAVQSQDLAAFRERYGSLNELAAERRMHFIRFKKEMTARGIEPAFGKPTIPATFYRRADIPSGL